MPSLAKVQIASSRISRSWKDKKMHMTMPPSKDIISDSCASDFSVIHLRAL